MLNFNSADAQTLLALHRLTSVELSPIMTLLNNQLEATLLAMISADETLFRRLQGRAGCIKEIIDAAKSASVVMEKLHSEPRS